MNYKIEALNWVRKHGETNTDYLNALHAIEFLIDDALEIAETKDDFELCELARKQALEILSR